MDRSRKIMENTDRFSVNNYNRYPMVIVRGRGAWLFDINGNKYLDMLAAYSAMNCGHSHPRIVNALREQAEELMLISGNYYNDKHDRLCKMITGLCGKEKVLFSSGGAESVEVAIKISRKWGYVRKEVKGVAEIICGDKNFHGRTLGALAMSPVPQYRDGFGPFPDGFKIVTFGDPDALGRAITKNTVAFFVEPIAGEGGIHVPSDGYLKEVEKICRKNNVLLVVDEIQTGFGRTGIEFAYMREHINPDIIIIGKSLGVGYPISAVLTDKNIMNVIGPGDHGSTFGGNPLACAVAIESIYVMKDEELSEQSHYRGEYLMSRLRQIKSPIIKEVRGRGLFIGVELKLSDGDVHRFCETLAKQGVLCTSARDSVVRFTPPLIITKEELNWGLERIERVFREWKVV